MRIAPPPVTGQASRHEHHDPTEKLTSPGLNRLTISWQWASRNRSDGATRSDAPPNRHIGRLIGRGPETYAQQRRGLGCCHLASATSGR